MCNVILRKKVKVPQHGKLHQVTDLLRDDSRVVEIRQLNPLIQILDSRVQVLDLQSIITQEIDPMPLPQGHMFLQQEMWEKKDDNQQLKKSNKNG